MTRGLTRTVYTAAAFLLICSASFFSANATIVQSVVDTGLFNPDDMAIDRSNGDIYITGFEDVFFSHLAIK